MRVFITFGQQHAHRIAGETLDKDTVAVINCESYFEGRDMAMEWFDKKFHQCLKEEEVNEEFMTYFPKGLVEIN